MAWFSGRLQCLFGATLQIEFGSQDRAEYIYGASWDMRNRNVIS